MAEARTKAEWSRTSSILAMLYNLNRGKGKPARAPAEFDPTSRRAQKGVDFASLRKMYGKRKKK